MRLIIAQVGVVYTAADLSLRRDFNELRSR